MSGKKHPRHYRLSLEDELSNFYNFWYEYFWHNWASSDWSIFTSPIVCFYITWKNESTKYALKWTKIRQKHPQHYRLWVYEGLIDFNIFSANIFDTTNHQTIALIRISPNFCFCTTWVKQKGEISAKMNEKSFNKSHVFKPVAPNS